MIRRFPNLTDDRLSRFTRDRERGEREGEGGRGTDPVDVAAARDAVQVLCEEAERLEVVVRQLVQDLLQLQHATLRLLDPIRRDHRVVVLWNHARNSDNTTRC